MRCIQGHKEPETAQLEFRPSYLQSHMIDCFKYTAAPAAARDTMTSDRSRAMETAGTSDNMQKGRGRERPQR